MHSKTRSPGKFPSRSRKPLGIRTERRYRLNKTNTIRLESQDDDVNGLIPTSPPNALQLPRTPGRASSDSSDGTDANGHLDEERSTNRHRPSDLGDLDAILPLPVPGSVRQRPSFPHGLAWDDLIFQQVLYIQSNIHVKFAYLIDISRRFCSSSSSSSSYPRLYNHVLTSF